MKSGIFCPNPYPWILDKNSQFCELSKRHFWTKNQTKIPKFCFWELASFLEKKIRLFFLMYPHNFQNFFFWELSKRHFWTFVLVSNLFILNLYLTLLFYRALKWSGFLSENDTSSVSKIWFFKKSPNLYTIIRVGFFDPKWR